MKFNLEFNPIELRDAIISGTLLSLVECINNNESEVEADAKMLKDTELPKPTTEKAGKANTKKPEKEVDKANSENKGKAEDLKPEDSKPDDSPKEEITLEQVRAKLAALSQSGKQGKVKALITKFGASKLSDIPAEKYAEVLSEAEGL